MGCSCNDDLFCWLFLAQTINQLLETRQYFAGASLTLADLFFCALLDSYVVRCQVSLYFLHTDDGE